MKEIRKFRHMPDRPEAQELIKAEKVGAKVDLVGQGK
jgi:hypothetical protein